MNKKVVSLRVVQISEAQTKHKQYHRRGVTDTVSVSKKQIVNR